MAYSHRVRIVIDGTTILWFKEQSTMQLQTFKYFFNKNLYLSINKTAKAAKKAGKRKN